MNLGPKRWLALLLIGFAWGPIAVQAHGGGLNADGCHNNRKTGDYHCHGGRPAAVIGGGGQPVPLVGGGSRGLPGVAAGGGLGRQGTAVPLMPASSGRRPTCYVGPRGGTYTIASSGRKNYGGC